MCAVKVKFQTFVCTTDLWRIAVLLCWLDKTRREHGFWDETLKNRQLSQKLITRLSMLKMKIIWLNKQYFGCVEDKWPNGLNTQLHKKTFLAKLVNIMQVCVDATWTSWVHFPEVSGQDTKGNKSPPCSVVNVRRSVVHDRRQLCILVWMWDEALWDCTHKRKQNCASTHLKKYIIYN